MSERYLIVSNPPHKISDPGSAASALNMTATEARMRYNVPAPEIWFAHDDLALAQHSARALVDAGLGIALVPGSVLSKVPIAVRATELAADQPGLTVTTRSGRVEITGANRVVAVLCEGLADEVRPRLDRQSILTHKIGGQESPSGMIPGRSGLAGAALHAATGKLEEIGHEARESMEARIGDIEPPPSATLFLDLYVYAATGWQAARVVAQEATFSGLGELKQLTARANILKLIEILRETCDGVMVDERLVKINYRYLTVDGTALHKLLGEISVDLAVLQPLDIASRLAFLTSKQ